MDLDIFMIYVMKGNTREKECHTHTHKWKQNLERHKNFTVFASGYLLSQTSIKLSMRNLTVLLNDRIDCSTRQLKSVIHNKRHKQAGFIRTLILRWRQTDVSSVYVELCWFAFASSATSMYSKKKCPNSTLIATEGQGLI